MDLDPVEGDARSLRVAVVGVGRLGRFHARIYSERPDAELVAVVDRDRDRTAGVADELGTRAAASLDDLPRELDAVSVAVPTIFHAEVAVPLLLRGIPCLVEKPLASDLEQADAILDAARRGGTQVAVGHVERFQPGLRKVLELGIRPRFIECHRLAPFSFRSTDIGVVHDLMIHDLDLILELMDGAEVESIDVAGGRILTDREDMASARIAFRGGARANVTASRVSLEPMRRFRLFSRDAYISLDFHENRGRMVRKGKGWEEGRARLRQLDPLQLAAQAGSLGGDLIEIVELEFDQHDRPLQAELASFLDAVRRGVAPEVTGEDGRHALELADRISAAVRAESW